MKETERRSKLGQPGHWEQTFREGDTVLLTAKADWPLLEGDPPGVRRIDRYCNALAARWRKRWEGPLLSRARGAAGPDTPPWEAQMTFRVTLLREDCFSFTVDITESTGAAPRSIRLGEAWSLPEGRPLLLREVLPPGEARRKKLLTQVGEQIEGRLNTGESLFYQDWSQRLPQYLSKERFYLEETGPVLFFPIRSIAPSLEGFPAFPLKNEKSACFFPSPLLS